MSLAKHLSSPLLCFAFLLLTYHFARFELELSEFCAEGKMKNYRSRYEPRTGLVTLNTDKHKRTRESTDKFKFAFKEYEISLLPPPK